MKTYTVIGLIFMLFLTGFTHLISGQEYTYLLQVNSRSEEEQFFDLEITSKLSTSPKPSTIVLSDQTTPFMRMLETGEHVMIIKHLGGGRLVSKVTGFLNGESKGSALGDDEKSILTAGPGGFFSAASQ